MEPIINTLNTVLDVNVYQAGAGVQLDNYVQVSNPDGTQFVGGSLEVSVPG